MKLYKQFETSVLDKYDDLYSSIIVINSPPIFVGLWSVYRSVVKEKSAAKVTVFGTDYREELLRFANVDELPREYGGDCRECPPGLRGCRYSDRGPWLSAVDARSWCFKERDRSLK
jgi:hypothetical protein